MLAPARSYAHLIGQRYEKVSKRAIFLRATKSLSRCLVVSLSFSWTMGLWDSGTMRRRGRREEKLFSLSHFLIFSLSFFGRWDDGTMGQWDYATMRPPIKISREAHLTFHFSPFTFHFPPNAPFGRGSPSERSFVRSLWLRKTAKTMGKWDSGSMGVVFARRWVVVGSYR